MECNLFFLNLAVHPSFSAHKTLLLEYMENITSFARRYFKERYNEDIDAHFYYPDFSPQTFEDLRNWDRTGWRDKYFGKDIQMYCVFDRQLMMPKKLIGGADPAGVEGLCLGKGEDQLTIDDMTYAYMPEYHSLFARDPYSWYENFGGLCSMSWITRFCGCKTHPSGLAVSTMQESSRWKNGTSTRRTRPATTSTLCCSKARASSRCLVRVCVPLCVVQVLA